MKETNTTHIIFLYKGILNREYFKICGGFYKSRLGRKSSDLF